MTLKRKLQQCLWLLSAFFVGGLSSFALGALGDPADPNGMTLGGDPAGLSWEIDAAEVRLQANDPGSAYLVLSEVAAGYPLGDPSEPVEISWENLTSTFPQQGLTTMVVYRLVPQVEITYSAARPCEVPGDCPLPWPPEPGPPPRQDMRFLSGQ